MAGNGHGSLKSNITEYMHLYGSPNEWFYRCEGLWTVAVFHRKIRRVLRLRKTKSDKKSTDLKEENYFRLTLNNLEFAKHVLSPLMGSHYMRVGEAVSLPKGFASAMNEMCRSHRPLHRLDKEIAESCSFGVIMPDFCFVPLPTTAEESLSDKKKHENPTFAVEIKPKCGFLPTSPYIDPKKSIKCSVCHYCMLQKSKVREGKYRRESKYCPVDLFSGDLGRVVYALECLVADPQNNLRIFCNGTAIFTEELVWEAIETRNACCAEKYLELVLKEISDFCTGNCVIADCNNCGLDMTDPCQMHKGQVTVEHHTSCNGMTTDCYDWERSVIARYDKFGDGVTSENNHSGDGVTSEGHRCGQTGPRAQQFLGVLLEILISDSKRQELSVNQAVLPLVSQSCKGSKYDDCKVSAPAKLSHLQFGNGGVFRQLLSIQKLDDIDVDGIYQLYQNVISHFKSNPGVRERLCVNGPYTSPLWKSVASCVGYGSSEGWQNIVDASEVNFSFPVLNPDLQDENVLHEAVLKICKFAVASTAKDSSVMIAFQRALNKEETIPFVATASGDTFHYNIALVDLDPKEFDRVLKYYKDCKSVVEKYLQ